MISASLVAPAQTLRQPLAMGSFSTESHRPNLQLPPTTTGSANFADSHYTSRPQGESRKCPLTGPGAAPAHFVHLNSLALNECILPGSPSANSDWRVDPIPLIRNSPTGPPARLEATQEAEWERNGEVSASVSALSGGHSEASGARCLEEFVDTGEARGAGG